jgi:hypothetical protein
MTGRDASDLPVAASVATLIAILIAIVMILASPFGDLSRIEFLLPLVLWTALALNRASSQWSAWVAPHCTHGAADPRTAHSGVASAGRR